MGNREGRECGMVLPSKTERRGPKWSYRPSARHQRYAHGRAGWHVWRECKCRSEGGKDLRRGATPDTCLPFSFKQTARIAPHNNRAREQGNLHGYALPTPGTEAVASERTAAGDEEVPAPAQGAHCGVVLGPPGLAPVNMTEHLKGSPQWLLQPRSGRRGVGSEDRGMRGPASDGTARWRM